MSVSMQTALPENFLEMLASSWATARGYKTDVINGHRAALRHDSTQDWEYFAYEPSSESFALLAKTALESPTRMLTVITNDLEAYRELARQSGLEVLLDNEVMMRLDMSALDPEPPRLASHSDFVTELQHHETHVSVSVTSDGRPAASGLMSTRDELAIFDRIATVPDFRRRGLGSYVMRTLAADAREKSARTGLLIASLDGQKLYEHMGWTTAYRVLILGNRAKNPLYQALL